ncbi:MAG: glycosyltransferase [Longimicrobiales bacterium]
MLNLAYILIVSAGVLVLYAYVGYPLLLKLALLVRRPRPIPAPPREWPTISITVPVFDEAKQISALLQSLLAIDYPADRRQILIVSDSSTDGTDEIVREFQDRGIELLRVTERRGKTAAEQAARPLLRGEIVVNTDASIRIDPAGLKPLIMQFQDPQVGLASGRDVSVAAHDADANVGESGYVGYEMWVRGLETRLDSIVGASGCFYAIRARLHGQPLPEWLSRDFAAALITRKHGYRAVSVDDARCHVPRTHSLRREYRRKVRTITRGMATLWHMRSLMNPFHQPVFAWMLFSHKITRWLVPWALLAAGLGLILVARSQVVAAYTLTAGLAVLLLGMVGWIQSEARRLPRWLSLPAAALAGNVAALHASLRALRGQQNAIWEPTRRGTVSAG